MAMGDEYSNNGGKTALSANEVYDDSMENNRPGAQSTSYATSDVNHQRHDLDKSTRSQAPNSLVSTKSPTPHNDDAKPTDSHKTPRRRSKESSASYGIPDDYTNLDELAGTSPVENFRDAPVYKHHSLEETRNRDEASRAAEQQDRQSRSQEHSNALQKPPAETTLKDTQADQVSPFATRLYTISYLILFSILGTLARVGLTHLTTYPGTPVIFSVLWANFGGSLIMGFLIEDRMLFRYEWGTATYHEQILQARQKQRDQEDGSSVDLGAALGAAKKAHLSTKKTIPLYIGLATGFCGSFTSFSSFVKDVFLAISNDLKVPGMTTSPSRSGGDSFMAMLAVIITTISLSLAGMFLGAHLAIASEGLVPSLPYPITRKFIDRLGVLVGWGCWLGAVLLAVFPPHDVWRGEILFALIFAPLGCLARFYLALYLNGKVAAFPLGTFAANILGTAVLGMAWDIQHVPVGMGIGCQVLQGVEDGFCGCLTTISTWVVELSSLKRRHSYIYGGTSVLVALALLIAIMGGLRWSDGFHAIECTI